MAEDESDQEAERLRGELGALVRVSLGSRRYCQSFCQVVDDYAGRYQVPLPQLQVLQTALCCFTSASTSYPAECEHIQYVLSRLALSLFELLLFFGKDEFYEAPLKDLIGSVQECNKLLKRNANMDLRLVTQIMQDGGPWENPVLQAILKGKHESQDLVNKFLSSENQLFFELRARYLIACERIPEAVALITSCLNHTEVSKNLYYHQAYFTCLYMTPSTDQLFQEHVLRIGCSDGIEIICSTEKDGKTALALQLCEAFLLRQLHSGDLYRIWDMIFIWSKLQIKSNSSKEVFVHRCYQLLRTATNIRVIFPFMKTIINEVGEAGIQLAVEICGCALQLDLRDDQYTKALIYKTIAHLLPTDLEVCRICVLSVFFLERSMDSYYAVERLYERPDEDYNEHTSSVENRVRFELLPILKKGLMFDPEFWSFSMIKQNCAALLGDKSAGAKPLKKTQSALACPIQQQPLSAANVRLAGRSNGELEHRYVSLSKSRREALAKKNHAVLGTYKVDHNVPMHRCMLCNREFLGGHIMRHAPAHQKKGCFTCVICGRKFRNRAIMVKHLKNHIKKIKRLKLVAADHVKETVTREEPTFCDTLISLENGNSDSSKDCNRLKDNQSEAAILSVSNKEEQTTEHVVALALTPISELEAVIENGNLSPCLNHPTEPLIAEGMPKYEECLNKDSPALPKINGSLCSLIKEDVAEKLKCPGEECVRVFKRIGSLSKHVRLSHPADLNAQKQICNILEVHALHKLEKLKCPTQGCARVFKQMGSLNKHEMIAHSVDIDGQQQICFAKEKDAVDAPVIFKCPGQGCVRVFKRLGCLNKHAKNAHPDNLVPQLQLPSANKRGDATVEKPGNFRCPHVGCIRVFKRIASLNKHTNKAHPGDLDPQLQLPSQNRRDVVAVDNAGNFKCPGQECSRVFNNVGSLNKHARFAHPADLNVQQHIMTYNKGKCRFCQRRFLNVQHFFEHLKRHVYPNWYFCLHFNCDQRFKLANELLEHSSSHDVVKAKCAYPECHQLFEDLSVLYQHEAEHYVNISSESCVQVSDKITLNTRLDPLSLGMEPQVVQDRPPLSKHTTSNCLDSTSHDASFLIVEKETINLSIPTWKARKESFEPKTYVQSTEKKMSMFVQNGSENSPDNASFLKLIDQRLSVAESVSESFSVLSEQIVNGHSEMEQTALVSLHSVPENETARTSPEKRPVLQTNAERDDLFSAGAQTPSKPKQKDYSPFYGCTGQVYVRPLPSMYLDERYISMPKRRKISIANVDTKTVQGTISRRPAERLRCGNCLTTYCNSEALEAHLAQKKCHSLFGFDSDEESAW